MPHLSLLSSIMTVVFAHAEPADAEHIFQWHRGFAAANYMLFPRSREQYERLVDDGRIFYAIEDGYYVGLCYYNWDDSEEHNKFWEVGGLMVDTRARGKGIGSALVRVTLASLLFNEDPLARHENIISHVHSRNPDPRRVAEEQLGFTHRGPIYVPKELVPGLPAEDDGRVHGDLYGFAYPSTLEMLASWCEGWNGKLREGTPNETPAEIQLFDGVTVELWGQAFRAMLDDPLGF